MKKIFLIIMLFFPLFCGAQEDNIYCRTIDLDGISTPGINDGYYTTNYSDVAISLPVSIVCQLYTNSHIDYVNIYKSSVGTYGSSTYLPGNIKIYASADNIDYILINEYSGLEKINDEVHKYNIITSNQYRWYKIDMYDCLITGSNNTCAISEIDFINNEDIEHIMSEEVLTEVYYWQIGMTIMIAFILFFLGMRKWGRF